MKSNKKNESKVSSTLREYLSNNKERIIRIDIKNAEVKVEKEEKRNLVLKPLTTEEKILLSYSTE